MQWKTVISIQYNKNLPQVQWNNYKYFKALGAAFNCPWIKSVISTAQSYEVITLAMNVISFICNTVNYSRKNTNSLVCHFQSLIHNFSCKRRLVIAPRIKVSKIKKGLKTTTKACQRCLRPAIIIKKFFLLLDFSTKLALRIEVVQGQFDPLVPLS